MALGLQMYLDHNPSERAAVISQKCFNCFQYNVFLRKNPRIDILAKVKESLLPVMWIEEYGEER